MFTRFLTKTLKNPTAKSGKKIHWPYLTPKIVARTFSEGKVYGGLADEDRIFVNIYGDEDVGLQGALARVSILFR